MKARKISLLSILTAIICLPIVFLPIVVWGSSFEGVHLRTVHNDLDDKESLQRGAKYFMNYCLSCHSLKYIRYEQIAKGIGLVDKNGKELDKLFSENLIFTNAKMTDPVLSSMPSELAKQAFGVVPPDLTLVSRQRGNNWLFTYFQSFYKDNKRPLGTNNLLFPDVAMPNVFEPLQGLQIPLMKKMKIETPDGEEEVNQIVALEVEHPGSMSPAQFDQMTIDLVNFLDYVGEPKKIDRFRTGVWVLLFLLIFMICAYLMKKEFWKDVH